MGWEGVEFLERVDEVERSIGYDIVIGCFRESWGLGGGYGVWG